ncbi:MAG: hypothetical protein ACOCW8_00190 [bacterium]
MVDYQVEQDLHIHTVFSKYDGAVVPEQTISFITAVNHAKILGISDHIESFNTLEEFKFYSSEVRNHGLFLGTEVDGHESVDFALQTQVDYFIYHCRDEKNDYRGAEMLLETGKPVIIAHPYMMGTRLGKVNRNCIIEINNRYIWRFNWKEELLPFRDQFRYVLGSDAHQPNWLNQNIAKHVANELNIEEYMVFPRDNEVLND